MISANATAGGTISPSSNVTVVSGASRTFTIAPLSGYRITKVVVDGLSVGAVSSYTFSNVSANHSIVAGFASMNRYPVASAGPCQVVASGETVTLNASNSTEADDIVSYRWIQTGGPSVSLSNVSDPVCTFRAPASVATALTFRLDVINRAGLTSSDTCIVNVTDTDLIPQAKAGTDQAVSAYTIVTLDGSGSSDPDDGIASYKWQQIAGPVIGIYNANTAYASFVAPDRGFESSTLIFQLTVTDYSGLKSIDRCFVNVMGANRPPVARAGADQKIQPSHTAVLDGSGSSDSESSGIFYRWTQLSGIPVTLSDPAAPKASFTAPALSETADLTFMLTVTDACGVSSEDKCTVTVVPNGNEVIQFGALK